jgi:homoserine kinase
MTIVVRAPATTANVGPGFDCVAIALDLWNEVELERRDGEADTDHLGVRAFARITPPEGWRFRWTDRIPRERGLGSSAATVALGLVAGELARGGSPDPEALLAVGVDLEGHADNLAAALAGGVCLTWEGRIARLGPAAPAAAILLVPHSTVLTQESRRRLPETVPHADAAVTAGRAALLGAALASGSLDLFASALHDRLHEPYRAQSAPLLAAVRANLPWGALGATLSGSGPSVVVWAEHDAAARCAAGLASRFPQVQVLPLGPAATGAVASASGS